MAASNYNKTKHLVSPGSRDVRPQAYHDSMYIGLILFLWKEIKILFSWPWKTKENLNKSKWITVQTKMAIKLQH